MRQPDELPAPRNPGRPELRVVDTQTGEVHASCPSCRALEDQLAGAENNVRSMRAQMAALKREVAGEVDREHKLFPRVVANFRYWQERCKHPNTELTADRMKAALPFHRRHDDATIRRAIRGAEFDPYVTTFKNGTPNVHNGWGLIFQSEDKFQSFVKRAPDPGPPTFTQRSMIEHAREIAGRMLERAKLIEGEGDPVAVSHLLLEIDRLNREWLERPREAG